MSFDPSTVDLSFVDPPLRAEVLHRIEVIEEFSRSRGPAARRKAREALGLNDRQIDLLARAWNARRRAEDITIRATRRSRPTTLSKEVLAIIERVADANPAATIVEIAAEVDRRADEAGLISPTYPTINKYVRERKAATRRATLRAIGHDILVDVTVTDIAVTSGEDAVRPHLVVVADGPGARLLGLSGTTEAVNAGHVAQALVEAISDDLGRLPGMADGPTGARVSICMPYATTPGWDRLSVALREAGAELSLHQLRANNCGRATAALFGTSLGGYKLRPRLVGRPAESRATVDPKRDPVPMNEAVEYLAAIAKEGDQTGPSPFARLGKAALLRLLPALERISERQE